MNPSRMNIILGVLASVILVSSLAVYAYSLTPIGDTSLLVVDGNQYTWDELGGMFAEVNFVIDEDEYVGYSMADIILDAGIEDHQGASYKFIGADGYQKDVQWKDIENAFITDIDHKAVFPGLTKSFWVRDLIEIRVN